MLAFFPVWHAGGQEYDQWQISRIKFLYIELSLLRLLCQSEILDWRLAIPNRGHL